MKTYILNIPQRISQFSKELDSKTVLMNQHWILFDELRLAKTVYIFRDNGRLLLSKDGVVEQATWEMLNPQTILISIASMSYLFRHGFLDENILALKLDGKSEFAVFLNESKSLTELNSIKDIEQFLESNYPIKEAHKPALVNESMLEEQSQQFAIFIILTVGFFVVLMIAILISNHSW